MSLFEELKRRNVIRVTIAYIVMAWLVLQVADVILNNITAPDWIFHVLLLFLAIGLPFAVFFAWAFELTPEGLKREHEVDRSQSITPRTGRKLDFMIIGVLAVALIYFVWESRFDNAPASSATPAVAEKSIAVLPFENRSADAEDSEFFSAGVHDELLTLLSRLGDIKVISRTSVERLDPTLSLPDIAALLGVATVLEGQVQRAGDRLRINVQLIDAIREDHLWATTYDRELVAGNVFEVQSDIARAIADALHARLSPDDEIVLNSAPTKNTEALNNYLLGTQQISRASYKSLPLARDYLARATELDPDYAQAWSAIANTYAQMLLTGMIDVNAYVAQAEPAILRALELDDRLAKVHAQLGYLKYQTGDTNAAEAAFKTALDLKPGDSDSLEIYGQYLRMSGRPAEAIPVLELALESNPLSVDILFNLGKSEMYLGHPEKNIQYGERIMEIDPASALGSTSLLQSYLWMGRNDQAWPWFLKGIAVDPEDFENWAHVAWHAETLGNPVLADRYMDGALQLGPEQPAVLKCLTMIHLQRGETAQANTIARKALEASLDDRWGSNQVFLRVLRDDALRTGDFEEAFAWFKSLHPELFSEVPDINISNINTAANLAMLMRVAGDPGAADALILAALAWYAETQPPGVYGYLLNIVDIELLALNGDQDKALAALQQAFDSGWSFEWSYHMGNRNLESISNSPIFQNIITQLEHETATQLDALTRLPYMGEFDLRTAKAD